MMSIITIVLNICQGYFCPMAAGRKSALFWIISMPGESLIYSVFSCAAMRDQPLCIHCTSMCSSQMCPCVCVSECLKQIRIFFSGQLVAGSLSKAGLGLWDVDLNAVSTFRGGVLSYRCRALCGHQSFSGFLPVLVHG